MTKFYLVFLKNARPNLPDTMPTLLSMRQACTS